VVSGAAALLLQQNPNLTPDQVKTRLMKTAYKNFPSFSIATDSTTGQTYQSEYDIFTVGAGYVDIAAALANTDLATLPASSPTVSYNPGTGAVSLVSGTNVAWGSNVAWGTSVVWGTSVFVGPNSLWGSNVAWGTSTTQGFNVVWGSNVAWGSANAIAAESDALAVGGEK
jgi:serine protease AprX